jgi:Icc-related predicted phosphoesterase
MRIIAVSDLHGQLPDIPSCDLLLLAGDLCPVENHDLRFQSEWLDTDFRRWLSAVPARKIVGIAGNHDMIFQDASHLLPHDLPWTYLQDQETKWEGLRIWGTPWQPWFFNWAFNAQPQQLQAVWHKIPEDTDILIVHGPPLGYGDGVPQRNGEVRHCGCPFLLQRIEEVRPRLVVFGHIHEGRGQWQLGDSTLANVTLLDERYAAVHAPWRFKW